MRFEELIQRLSPGAFQTLPGPDAQAALAPRPRPLWDPGRVPADARPAAALALLYPREGEPVLLLTVRGAGLAKHRSQVSFPGGAIEGGETPEEAALREAREEVGLDTSVVVVRGRLTPLHIPVSGYVLTPVVATTDAVPMLLPCAREVERLIEAPLAHLTGGDALRVVRRERDGQTYDVPLFAVGEDELWGATAMIVAELLSILGAPPDPWRAPGAES
jgi:8-oxo-dGTP pyrophosphatase MutT (NUDIX family)